MKYWKRYGREEKKENINNQEKKKYRKAKKRRLTGLFTCPSPAGGTGGSGGGTMTPALIRAGKMSSNRRTAGTQQPGP
jgi:hypothetical protein